MLKNFKDIPNPCDFDVRPYRTKMRSNRVIERRAALCRNAAKG
jgi:hypothetical protein